LRRTLYTALLTFPEQIKSGMKIIALPELQETSDLPCDTGSDREVLEKEFGEHAETEWRGTVDLSRVEKGWNDKGPSGPWYPVPRKIEARCKVARNFLRELGQEYAREGKGEAHIAVTTHGGVLHFFTEDWSGYKKRAGTGWENTEYRSYTFRDKGKNASIEETAESRHRRTDKPLTEDEVREYKASSLEIMPDPEREEANGKL
jgi:broad specificity phosphatase PhoE